MAKDDNKSVRRFNRKDRKSRIEVDHSRFMPKQDADFPDLSDVEMPDPDAEALESLQRMDDVMRPLVVTPQADRYPPVSTADDLYADEPKRQPKPIPTRPRHSRRNNFFTLLFLILTVATCGYYALVWVNPETILNPLAPPTQFQIVTATVDPNPVFVPTALPTLADGEPTATPSADDLHPYAIAPDGVLYVSNQNGRECNWSSIAGSVTNSSGIALPGFGIRVTGDGVSATVFSGTSPTFGDGGYEINLGGVPIMSDIKVQLVTTAGAPLSAELMVTTRADCNENVAIVNFVQR